MVKRIVALMTGVFVASFLFVCEPGYAEWYVAGYGGVSTDGSISNVDLPSLALTTVMGDSSLFNPNCTLAVTQNCMISQQMSASDIHLDDSPMFGAKVGHFFGELDLPWLGLELEGFTSKPNIAAQTLSTTLKGSSFIPIPPQSDTFPREFDIAGQLPVQESSLRVTTLALNLLARYPEGILQPYVGLGLGGFWFDGEGQFEGSRIVPGLNALGGLRIQFLENWVIFGEAKYNRATVKGLGPTLGMEGDYEIIHWLGGIAFVFGTN